jgi:hypothetical protein
MIYSLPDVKKELKKMYSVKKIVVWLEEFGEGFNVYSSVEFLDKHLVKDTDHFDLAEEEKLGKAEARAKRIVDSLKKQGYNAIYEGVANC